MAIIKIYTALAVAFAALAAAAPAQPTLESRQAGTTEPLRFGGLASRDDSPINLSPINANGLRFVIGKNTTTYTPEGVEGLDPANYNTNQTIFAYLNGFGTLELSSGVPGSQQVYVTEGDEATGQLAGQLRFTQAHSTATAGPPLYDGFSIVYDGKLQFEGKDWFACELDEFNSGYGIWSVARLAGSHAGEGCLAFTWKVAQVGNETLPAWQYVK